MENFSIIQPSGVLTPFVSHYWLLQAGGSEPAGERIIPTGSVSLVFHRADLMRSVTEGGMQPRVFISGVVTDYSDLRASGKLDMLVVVFRPLGSRAFFGIPLDEFRNASVSVADTGDGELIKLADRVLSEHSAEEAVAHIEKFLVSRLYRHDNHIYRRMARAISMIDSDPEVTVAESAGAACLSTKQFNRIFAANVGIRPKEFMRIVRFQRALHVMQSHSGINFAQLAASCGYYDQAHMIKEFREFSGYTPGEYLAVCQPYSDYFSNH